MRVLHRLCFFGLLTMLAAGLGAATVRAGEPIGANCVQPLDFQALYQDLRNCNLKGVTIDGNSPVPGSTPLYGANLTGANLMGATVTGGYKPLQFANLTGANLKGATLGGGANEFAVLQGANLTKANLAGVIVNGFRPLSGTNLTGANLLGAVVTGTDPFEDAIFSNTLCPDGTNSDKEGGTCVGHGIP